MLAGLVLGHFGDDAPNVSEAARAFGERMVEIDTSIGEMWQLLESNSDNDKDGEP